MSFIPVLPQLTLNFRLVMAEALKKSSLLTTHAAETLGNMAVRFCLLKVEDWSIRNEPLMKYLLA